MTVPNTGNRFDHYWEGLNSSRMRNTVEVQVGDNAGTGGRVEELHLPLSPTRSFRLLQKQTSIASLTCATTASTWSTCSTISKDSRPIQPTRKAKNSDRKKVTFHTDEEGDIKAEVIEFTKIYDEETKGICFYQRDERKRMRREALMAATEYTMNFFESVYDLECLLGSPLAPRDRCLPKAPPASRFTTAAEENNSKEGMEAILDKLVAREARGLEMMLSHLLRRHKQWANYTVLHLQMHIQKQDLPFQVMEQKMRACCLEVNRVTRDLAIQQGRADEKEAQRIHQGSACR